MFRKILVPLDGSDFSEHALPLAVSVAARTGGEVQIATAVPTLPPLVPASGQEGTGHGWFEEERGRAADYLEGIHRRLTDAGVQVPLHPKVLAGGAVASIDQRVRQTGVHLVVMTTHGRGPLERMWLGSVADGLIRTAPCPVLLSRPEEGPADLSVPPSFERILVPLDGSPESETVLPEAAGLARAFDASLHLLSVVPAYFPLGSTYIPHAAEEARERDRRRDEFEEYLTELAGRLREEGLEVSAGTALGDDPAGAIMEYREASGADLVALSSRGRGGVARLVLGSTADKVIRAGRVPVLVHRRPDAGPGG